jgi:hypothetical protein
MTEPYFITVPVGNGEIVGYIFVDQNNDPVDFSFSNPDMFLKLKISKNMINEIDNLIKTNDVNTDIIETLTINDPLTKLDKLLTDSNYYNKFGNTSEIFFRRQDDCLDDLIGDASNKLGIVGQGHHKVYTIDPTSISIDPSKYSTTMKVNGLGYVSKLLKINNVITLKNFLNIYCSNYVAINAPAPGSYTPIAIFISDTSIINTVKQYEKNYPMIKLAGMNGYIKILERNEFFPITRSKDGGYEVVYNVEFPYCPGSYSERVAMDFSDYQETWILKKLSYIPAGSNETFGVTPRYNISNERHVPLADDSFGIHDVLMSYGNTGTIKTAPFINGGGIYNIPTTQQNLTSYPANLVWVSNVFNMISITKSRLPDFKQFGTYDIRVSNNDKDIKVIGLLDNRKWRFSDNKFISYINKENPSYICDINTSTLFKNFVQYQKDHASIPDIKRWLYGLFSGFSTVMDNADPFSNDEDSVITENVNTILNNDLTSEECDSDIIIEVWDRYSKLGDLYEEEIRGGNWRPLSPINSDTNKVAGNLLLNYLYVVDGSLIHLEAEFPGANIYSLLLGYLDPQGSVQFPAYVYFNTPNDIIDERSNLVLFNTQNNFTYHVAYIRNEGSNYKAYIYYDPSQSTIPTIDISDVDIGVSGPLSLCLPKKQLNKDISFKLYTSNVVQGIAESLITRFIDLRSSFSGANGYTDFQRYIDEDNKLFFRVRVVKNKNYPVSYSNEDESTLQYLWAAADESATPDQWVNYPWGSDYVYDDGFYWGKVRTNEIIRKFGMTYFKCASK